MDFDVTIAHLTSEAERLESSVTGAMDSARRWQEMAESHLLSAKRDEEKAIEYRAVIARLRAASSHA